MGTHMNLLCSLRNPYQTFLRSQLEW